MQAPKRSEMLVLYDATLQVGATFLTLNTGYKQDELTYFIEDAGPSLIACGDAATVGLAGLARGQDAVVFTLNADGSGTLMWDVAAKPRTFATVAFPLMCWPPFCIPWASQDVQRA